MFDKRISELEELDRRTDWRKVETFLLPLRIVGIVVALVLFASLFVERTAVILWVIGLLGFVR